MQDQPEAAWHFLQLMARRLRRTNDALENLLFADVPRRVARALMDMASRFGDVTAEGVRVHHELTQEQLAQYVGASRESVNKALSDLANRGVIRLEPRAVPALWNPLNFAEQVNTLDLLTRGRCVIGVGTGGSPQEYEGLGRDPQDRGPLMGEVLNVATAAMRKTGDDPDLEYSTRHASGVLTRRIMPTSFTKPHPRFARAALSDGGIVYTAEHGWALMTAREAVPETARKWKLYHDTLNAAGHDQQTLSFARDWSMVQKMVYIGEDDASAMEEVAAPLDYLAEQSMKSFGGTAAAAGFKNSIVGVSAVDREDFLKKAMIVGRPDTVAQTIGEYQDAGVEHLTLVFLYGQMNPALATCSLRRFIDEVMPRFSDPVLTAYRLAASAASSG